MSKPRAALFIGLAVATVFGGLQWHEGGKAELRAIRRRRENEVACGWSPYAAVRRFWLRGPFGNLGAAPAGSEIDGASTPQAFWSIIGGPFDGAYRNASVVHDVACVRKKERWEAVHRMFYDASLCGGVEVTKAKVMYAAVYLFGHGGCRRMKL